jgi:hypothetical protein
LTVILRKVMVLISNSRLFIYRGNIFFSPIPSCQRSFRPKPAYCLSPAGGRYRIAIWAIPENRWL